MNTLDACDAPFLEMPEVQALTDVFVDAGYGDDFRFVGGCVRNHLMDLPLSDIDVATKLHPEQVRAIFVRAGWNVHDTGIEHGTVMVTHDKAAFEVTTLRRDVETDGRRAVIEFSTDWAEDAFRRDFRCNALFMDRHGIVYDYVDGGIGDANDKRLIFVGDPDTRIREDYLRVLRLFRFMATLGAKTDEVSLDACARLKDGLGSISGERIQAEMMKLLSARDRWAISNAFQMLMKSGVYDYVISSQPPCVQTFRLACTATEAPEVRLASLFLGDPDVATETLDRWKVSNVVRDRVTNALRGPVPLSLGDLREIAYRRGIVETLDRMALSWADDAVGFSLLDLKVLMQDLTAMIPQFRLKGSDLLELGVKPGPEVGRILREIETWWIGADYPDRDACIERAREVIGVAA